MIVPSTFALGIARGPVLEVAARTDPGKKRAVNEDWVLAADPCFLVADGMGGHEAGDEASRAAIGAFTEAFTAPGPATFDRVEAAIDRARYEVSQVASRSMRGAGCTLTGVVRVEHEGTPSWYVLNIGDSRVYLQRGDELMQLTADHSLQSELEAQGRDSSLTPRNVITRALGSADDRHDAWLLPLETGSRVLVCSDGLTTEIDDESIHQVLSGTGRPAEAVDELLRRSLDAGGRDNVTLIVVDVVAGGIERAEAAGAVGGEDSDDASTAEADDDLDDGDDTIERTNPRRR